MKLRMFLILILLTASLLPVGAVEFGIDGTSYSLSTWRTGSDNTGGNAQASWFTTGEAHLYYHAGSIKGFIGLPVMLSLQSFADHIDYAVYPADMPLYFGRQWGPLEPRLGIRIPLGYPTVDTVAWIGAGTLQAIAGTGFSLGTHANKRLSMHGEIRARISLTGLDRGGRIDRGSVSWYVYTNATWHARDQWDLGIELSPYGDYFPSADWSTEPWHTFGVMPVVLLQYHAGATGSFALRVGTGREYTGTALETSATTTTIALTWSRF